MYDTPKDIKDARFKYTKTKNLINQRRLANQMLEKYLYNAFDEKKQFEF